MRTKSKSSIQKIFEEGGSSYGYRRIHAQLVEKIARMAEELGREVETQIK